MRALVVGVSGQDGAYLSKLLIDKGYEVWGTSRDAHLSRFEGLAALGIQGAVRRVSVAPNDFRSVLNALVQCEPDEIYNLSGQSSVGLSFDQPVETMESVAIGTLNLLEAIRFTKRPIRFYNASSGECFGDTGGVRATEESPFRPRSPYAVAKAAAHLMVANYRSAYGLFACSGILFNHDSPLRPERFVTRKIVVAACQIAKGSKEALTLGNISVQRDWGWAPEYVEAMWRMLQQDTPSDFVIATGTTRPLQDFIEAVFARVGLEWREHVETDPRLFRPSDLSGNWADPSRAAQVLDWTAQVGLEEVARRMVEAELERTVFAGP